MPFEKRHQEIIKKIKPLSQWRLAWHSLFLGSLVFIAGSLYLFARRGDYDLYIANKVFATTALVLIGLSFLLSAFCYFWDFVDTKIVYRKHLGLMGFAFAVVHVVVTVWFLPHKFPWPEWLYNNLQSAVFAGLALLIFALMAAVSNRYAVHELGSKGWRLLLRVGYVALIFVIIHFAFLKYNGWLNWFKTREPILPPLSLLEVIFAVGVIAFRIVLWLAVRKKKKEMLLAKSKM